MVLTLIHPLPLASADKRICWLIGTTVESATVHLFGIVLWLFGPLCFVTSEKEKRLCVSPSSGIWGKHYWKYGPEKYASATSRNWQGAELQMMPKEHAAREREGLHLTPPIKKFSLKGLREKRGGLHRPTTPAVPQQNMWMDVR